MDEIISPTMHHSFRPPFSGRCVANEWLLWLNFVFVIITAFILLYYNSRIGCITGDMMGAMTEVLESALFLLVVI